MLTRSLLKLILVPILLLLSLQICLGAQISGTVYNADGSTPITNGNMEIRIVFADHNYLGGIINEYTWGFAPVSNTDGTFSLSNLPAGSYFLQISLQHHEDNYIEEWWNAAGSVHDASAAQPLTVETGSVIEGISVEVFEKYRCYQVSLSQISVFYEILNVVNSAIWPLDVDL